VKLLNQIGYDKVIEGAQKKAALKHNVKLAELKSFEFKSGMVNQERKSTPFIACVGLTLGSMFEHDGVWFFGKLDYPTLD
jgi:hypothetical protein